MLNRKLVKRANFDEEFYECRDILADAVRRGLPVITVCDPETNHSELDNLLPEVREVEILMGDSIFSDWNTPKEGVKRYWDREEFEDEIRSYLEYDSDFVEICEQHLDMEIIPSLYDYVVEKIMEIHEPFWQDAIVLFI